MARQDGSLNAATTGFEGGLPGLGLSDLVQIAAQNRFSGCFRLDADGQVGVLFFRDGEIVHAEVGQTSGEEAFCELVGWPRGRFTAEPNVVTTQRTIQKSCEHLLLDAHRRLDEKGVLARGEPVPRREAAPPPDAPAAALEAVRALPGVVAAVLLTRDGQVADEGYEADVLGAQAAYLGMLAAELGAVFQAGDVRSAAAQGALSQLLLHAGTSHLLGIAARPDGDVASVHAAVRRVLGSGR